jgi:hypothetical protein
MVDKNTTVKTTHFLNQNITYLTQKCDLMQNLFVQFGAILFNFKSYHIIFDLWYLAGYNPVIDKIRSW